MKYSGGNPAKLGITNINVGESTSKNRDSGRHSPNQEAMPGGQGITN